MNHRSIGVYRFWIAFYFFLIILISGCSLKKPNNLDSNDIIVDASAEDKQKGGHLFGYIQDYCLDSLADKNFDWITLVPFGSQKDYNSAKVIYYRGDSTQMRKRDSMWRSEINLAKEAGFKVFLKPHVWLNEPTEGLWRSDIFPTNEDNWQLWQDSYREFIMYYAKLAEASEVDLFCIGAEFTKLTREKPGFWISLIADIRKIYSGKLTYAANWYKEYEDVPFWKELDFIGIQAYFPLSNKDNPSVKHLSVGWDKHLPKLEALHKKQKRKIIFTEMGYKSTADSAIKPWRWLEYSDTPISPVSNQTQSKCYQAFFESVWNKEWFGGVHIWQMRCDGRGNGKHGQLDFTPLGKPAADIIAKGFQTHS